MGEGRGGEGERRVGVCVGGGGVGDDGETGEVGGAKAEGCGQTMSLYGSGTNSLIFSKRYFLLSWG